MNNLNELLNNLTSIEREQVLKILKDIKSGNNSSYNNLINDIWEEVPVDIDTFIDDDKYMREYFYPDGKSCIVYPRWRKELKEIFKNPYKYSEICLLLAGDSTITSNFLFLRSISCPTFYYTTELQLHYLLQ